MLPYRAYVFLQFRYDTVAYASWTLLLSEQLNSIRLALITHIANE